MRIFRTSRNGQQMFYIDDHFYVARIGPYEGAVAEATALWPTNGVPTVEVSDDVGLWLDALP